MVLAQGAKYPLYDSPAPTAEGPGEEPLVWFERPRPLGAAGCSLVAPRLSGPASVPLPRKVPRGSGVCLPALSMHRSLRMHARCAKEGFPHSEALAFQRKPWKRFSSTPVRKQTQCQEASLSKGFGRASRPEVPPGAMPLCSQQGPSSGDFRRPKLPPLELFHCSVLLDLLLPNSSPRNPTLLDSQRLGQASNLPQALWLAGHSAAWGPSGSKSQSHSQSPASIIYVAREAAASSWSQGKRTLIGNLGWLH